MTVRRIGNILVVIDLNGLDTIDFFDSSSFFERWYQVGFAKNTNDKVPVLTRRWVRDVLGEIKNKQRLECCCTARSRLRLRHQQRQG